MADWFKDALDGVPKWARTLALIFGGLAAAFSAGGLFMAKTAELKALSPRVSAVEMSVREVREDVTNLQRDMRGLRWAAQQTNRKLDRMLCNLDPAKPWSECEREHPIQ